MGESAMKFKVKREERRRRNLSENNAFGYFGHTTVRLPPALDALVQARVRTGTPFAMLIREALSAYLADSMPPPADRTPTPPALTPADSADMVHVLGEQLAILRARVKALEYVLTACRHHADRPADRPADTR